mgnify:CR=1 FL=1|tara:strand:- start:9 stop:1205 length:1197 start_codon:yes stop_codon:yes gene_type:complete
MTLPFSGTITLNDINAEFGNGASLTQNYSGNLTSTERDNHPLVPASGDISLWDFYTVAAPSSGPGLFIQNHNMLVQTFGTDQSTTDAAGDTVVVKTFTGWEVMLGQLVTGVSNTPGTNVTSPTDTTYPTNNLNVTQNNQAGNSGPHKDTNINHSGNSNRTGDPSYSASFITPDYVIDGSASGHNAIKLSSSLWCDTGFDVVRGPILYSASARAVAAGERVKFLYRAESGGDAYDLFAYAVDTSSGSQQILLNTTQNSSGGATDWLTSSTTITTSGNYLFVFCNGTFDFTGGRFAGATVYVTNIEVGAGGSLTENGGFSNVGNNPNWTSNTTTSAVTFTTSGNGIDAVLNIQTVGTQAIIRVIDGGSGFAVGDSITVGGQQLGGNASGDDLTFNVAALA